MQRLIKKEEIFAGFKMNNSMAFTTSIGIGMLNSIISRVLNSVSDTLLAQNESPKYSRHLYDVSLPMVRLGNGYNKSTMNYW